MNLDGLTLTVLTKQLANRLMGGQLQKVLQVDKPTMVFKINGPQGNENLVVTDDANLVRVFGLQFGKLWQQFG